MIKKLTKKAKQKLFNKVATHLLKQNAKAETGGYCKYRTSDGEKCAVGVLLPPAVYAKTGECGRVENLLGYRVAENYFNNYYGDTSKLKPMLMDLQRIHDTQDVGSWGHNLLVFAATYGLRCPLPIRKLMKKQKASHAV